MVTPGPILGASTVPRYKSQIGRFPDTIACVAWRFWLGALSNKDGRGQRTWRFWLGALSNKGGRGQRNREEIGAGQNRHATQATDTKE